jgi:hypothetical protein
MKKPAMLVLGLGSTASSEVSRGGSFGQPRRQLVVVHAARGWVDEDGDVDLGDGERERRI